MAATVNGFIEVQCTPRTGTDLRKVGNRNSAVTITLTEDDGHGGTVFTVANNATVDLWEPSSGPVGGFEIAVIRPSVDMFLEITVDSNAGVGTELMALKLRAGWPFILSNDIAYANYTVNFGGGTLDVIDRLRVRNLSGGDGYVELFLFN
jgi:hypothetical protein